MLKEILSAPFTSAARRLLPLATCEQLPGKSTDALRRISKTHRRSVAPKYPLALLSAPISKNFCNNLHSANPLETETITMPVGTDTSIIAITHCDTDTCSFDAAEISSLFDFILQLLIPIGKEDLTIWCGACKGTDI